MDKNLLLGALLGAAVTGGAIAAPDLISSADAATRSYRAPVSFALSEAEAKSVQAIVTAHAPSGCAWMSVRLDPTSPVVARVECKIAPKSLDDVPAGAVIEVAQ